MIRDVWDEAVLTLETAGFRGLVAGNDRSTRPERWATVAVFALRTGRVAPVVYVGAARLPVTPEQGAWARRVVEVVSDVHTRRGLALTAFEWSGD